VVACCNRLDRCWELPRLNPLHAEFDPWHQFAATADAETADEAVQQAALTAALAQATFAVGFVPTRIAAGSGHAAEDDWPYLPDPDDNEYLDEADEEDEQP
jgi:hypothetical protein